MGSTGSCHTLGTMEYEPSHLEPEPQRRGLQIFGFPLRIDPFFLVTAWLIGGRQEPQWIVIWIVVVFFGVLAHELGHAFAGRRLGLQPWIQLMAFGGMTGWLRPRPLTAGQQIAISAAGPAVGIAIGGGVLLASLTGVFAGAPPAVARVVRDVLWVNLGWALLNLLPILPLDGGHIMASIADVVAGRNGRVAARIFSVILTVAIGLWALLARQWWILILGVVLTFANVQGLRAEMARFS
jgi:stage IV sporulation protein FB